MDVFVIDNVLLDKDLRPCQKIVLTALAYLRPSRVDLARAVTKGARNNQYRVDALLTVMDTNHEATIKKLSEVTSYTPRQLRNILNRLSVMGLVERKDGSYVLAEESKLMDVRGECCGY